MNKLFRIFALLMIFSTFFAVRSFAQARPADPVTYETLYDDPEAVKRLFVAFQPIFGELWATNPHAGFGMEAWYFLKDKADFRVHLRKAYGTPFDFARESAVRNSTMQNEQTVLNHFEFGGTYHFKEEIKESETKMVLYKQNYEGARWTAQVPLSITVPSQVRKIYGARLGGVLFDTSADLNRIFERQNVDISKITAVEGGQSLPTEFTNGLGDLEQVNVFSNVDVKGIYAGVSLSWIRNVAVDIDKHSPGVDDRLITTYFDLLIAPWVTLDNVYYQDQEYSVQSLKTNPVGFRFGLDGKFNRTLSWGYGAEAGIKPGLKSGGFFVLLKISMPIYATEVDYEVEAFEK